MTTFEVRIAVKEFFTKVLDKFHHPIGLLLFALGAILILTALSNSHEGRLCNLSVY